MSNLAIERLIPAQPPTSREVEVLSLLIAGNSRQTIATALGIATRTVEAHISSARRKVGAKNVAQLCVIAIQQGWITCAD